MICPYCYSKMKEFRTAYRCPKKSCIGIIPRKNRYGDYYKITEPSIYDYKDEKLEANHDDRIERTGKNY